MHELPGAYVLMMIKTSVDCRVMIYDLLCALCIKWNLSIEIIIVHVCMVAHVQDQVYIWLNRQYDMLYFLGSPTGPVVFLAYPQKQLYFLVAHRTRCIFGLPTGAAIQFGTNAGCFVPFFVQ